MSGRSTRRELLATGAGAALAAYGLAGCTVSRQVDKSARGQAIKPKIDGDLLIYNWAQYMDPALKSEFAEKYGVEVQEVNFDNLEAMVIKLRSGASYDLIWPSTEYVARLNNEGLIARFDRELLRNNKNISPFYDSPWWDPDNDLSVPYAYYTTGIAWRNDIVSGMKGSWNDLVNPDADGKMFILDDFQEAIGQANLLNDFDLNTTDGTQIEKSKQTLLDQKQYAVLHQAWNGDIVNVRNQVDDPDLYSYETCKEGVPVGTDLMCIPITAKSPGTAMLFIDWLITPENAYRNVMWNGYPQPVEGGQQAFAELVKTEPSIDVDLEALEDSALEYRLDDPTARQLWTETFVEVKAA